MKIAILGTRGIPNRYGGFEQLTEHLSVGLAAKGHEISVYSPHNHPYREKEWHGVNIIHCHDPENRIGTAGQFIYDLNCVLDARKRKPDLLLFLGYTSSSVWGWLYPGKTVVVSHMDGMEWKRSKYSKPVQQFLKRAEKLAVTHSDFFIADSPVIQTYLEEKYGIESEYIAYGATRYPPASEAALESFGLLPGNYFLLIARMEPENNIEMILEGFVKSKSKKQFVVVGNAQNQFGRTLKEKYKGDGRISWPGAIYDAEVLHAIKQYCYLYFHGHSVGGTNPSLLEAMASGACIVAHENPFNRAVLGQDALYFENAQQVQAHVEAPPAETLCTQMVANNLTKIEEQFNWERIIVQYEKFLLRCEKEITA